MSSKVWFAFTETSVGAGKNNEYPEIDAWLERFEYPSSAQRTPEQSAFDNDDVGG
jgi:hypothetical protein